MAIYSFVKKKFQAQAAKENDFKQQVLNGPSRRSIKRHTPPIHQNPLRLQQSPTSNQTSSSQNRNSLQFLSFQPKASSKSSQSTPTNTQSTANRFTVQPLPHSNRTRASSPLDLSAAPVSGSRFMNSLNNSRESLNAKRKRTSPSPTAIQLSSKRNRAQTPISDPTASTQNQRRCHAQMDEISSWTVEQVCDFVSSIDICTGYVEVRASIFSTIFRRQTKFFNYLYES